MNPIKTLYKNIIIGDIKNTEVEPDVDVWYRFLASLPEPKDCIEAAYNKYLCRKEYIPVKKRKLLNAAACLMLTTLMPKVRSKKEPMPKLDNQRLLFEMKRDLNYEDVVPQSLFGRFESVEKIYPVSPDYSKLTKEAQSLFMKLRKKYKHEYYFQLFVLKELAIHSCYLAMYNPSAAAVYVNERNIATPVIKELYEMSGRKFISFMHGEYLLQMIQAYMSFSEFYVWDEQYISMFRDDLHCGIGQYIVETPLKLTKKWNLEAIEPTVYCTYYFSGESTTSVRRLAEVFKKMAAEGKVVKVRPHPRYSHLQLIDSEFDPELVEDPKEISMRESLARTRYAVGLHTTVLSEAQVEGRTAVIDDISDPPQFENLKKRKFVALGREHRLLSEII